MINYVSKTILRQHEILLIQKITNNKNKKDRRIYLQEIDKGWPLL